MNKHSNLSSVEALMTEHTAMDALAATLDAIVQSPAPNVDEAVACRGKLSTLLDYHLACERKSIYPALAASDEHAVVSVGNDFVRELEFLSIDWQAYLKEWTTDVITFDWGGFAGETRSMMARLRDRIDRETQFLLPLAVRVSAIPLKAKY
ncbi:MAG: hemerythrin domain-containing protein [Sphingomonas sp.]